MSCIKTGARVYFENYDCTAPADIYSIPHTDAVVVRVNGALENVGSYLPEYKERATHRLVTPAGDPGFWRNDLGVFVTHKDCLTTLPVMEVPKFRHADDDSAGVP